MCQTLQSYDSSNFRVKKTIMTVMGKNGRKGPWGTHTMRKTGYLLAIWGGGSVENIMLSARHSTVESAEHYYQDAGSLLQMAKIQGYSIFKQIL